MDDASREPEETLFLHEGEISLSGSEAMFGEMRALAEAGTIPRSAFRVFIELVQNIRLHGDASGTLRVTKCGNFVTITAGNAVSNPSAEKVRAAVNYANLHSGMIASVIREMRNLPVSNGANGAGLGLFEIRRQSCKDLMVEVLAAGEGNSELVITVTLKHNSTP